MSNLTMTRRKANFMSTELRTLVQEISHRKSILYFRSNSNDTNEVKRNAWADIARIVNLANGGYAIRYVHELKKKWREMQRLVRRKLAAQKRGTNAQEGRVPGTFQQLQRQGITDIDRQVLAVLSGLSQSHRAEDSGMLTEQSESDEMWTSNLEQEHMCTIPESVKTEPVDTDVDQLDYQSDDLNPDSPSWGAEEEQDSMVDGETINAESLLSDDADATDNLMNSSSNMDSGLGTNGQNQDVGLDLILYNQEQLQVQKERLCVEKRRLGLETRRLIIEEQRLEIERRRLELEENRFKLNDEQAHAQNSPKTITLTLSAAANPTPNQNA